MSDEEHRAPDGVQEWLAYAERDLHGAQSLLAGGDYAWALVLCQQAIEKALKALILQKTEEMPPRSHRLLQLAEWADVEFSGERAELVSDLDLSYMESRYPGIGIEPGEGLDDDVVAQYVAETEEIVAWLSSKRK